MIRNGFRLSVLALGLLKLLTAWGASRKRPRRSRGFDGEGVVALGAELRELRAGDARALYLSIGLFLGRSRRRPQSLGRAGSLRTALAPLGAWPNRQGASLRDSSTES